jgi:hypothetical protein
MEGAEEVDDTPVSRLIPALLTKVAGSRGLDGPERSRGLDGPGNRGLDGPGQEAPEAADQSAARDLEKLRLQAITPREAKEAMQDVDVGAGHELTDDLIQLIKKHQELDPYCRWVARQQLHKRTQLTDPPVDASTVALEATGSTVGEGFSDLLCITGRVIVPEQASLRHELLRHFHDCPTAGHWGEKRTMELLRRSFYWPRLGKDVKEWISTCPQCQSKAIHRHKPYGQLQPFTPEDGDFRPFKHIAVDWITGLPKSRRRSTGEVFDAILTVVCRVTKAARFIPTQARTTAADFARIFFENIECEYGTPTSIVSDRDSRITSEFWAEICNYQILITNGRPE